METKDLLDRARAMSSLPSVRRRRQIRMEACASQYACATVLGVSVMSFNRWERGITKPRGPHAVAYASLLTQLEDATAEDAP